MFLKNFLKKIAFLFICLFVFSCIDIHNAHADDNENLCYKDEFSGDSTISAITSIAKYIPILGNLVNYTGFYIRIVGTISDDLFDGEAIIQLLTDLATILVGTPEANIVFQKTFDSNQYCQYQDIFKEEDSFLNADNKRYSIFPVIPLEIGIDSKGQCNISGALNGNFKQLVMNGNGASGTVDTPLGTKCSYSYTNLNPTCLFENTLPLAIVGETAQMTADIVCGFNSGSSSSASRIKKFLSYSKKVISGAGTAASYVVELMAFPIFEYDAYSLKNYYGASLSIMGIYNLVKALVNQNYICSITSAVELAITEVAMPIASNIIFSTKYNQAKDAIEDLRFCGYDWYSYAGVKQGQSDFLEDDFSEAEYFERGPFKKSYSYAVSSCIDNANYIECKNKLENFGVKIDNTYKIINDDIFVEKQDTIINRSLFNRIYREYLYNGKEYRFNYKKNESYDPRLPEYKGYYDVAHRYYMRGNEKANYACERFTYSGFGCVLREEDVLIEDRSKFENFLVKNTSEKFYIIKGNNIYKYDQICKDKFNEAYENCFNRSRKNVCIESIKEHNNKFCEATYETDQVGRTSIMSTIINGVDDVEGYCYVGYGNSGKTAELLVVKQLGNQYACVFSNNFCPYDFKLNAGLNYKASYCEADYTNQYVEDGEDVFDVSNYKYKVASNLDSNVCAKGIFTKNTCSIIEETGSNIKHKKYAFDRLRENVGSGYYKSDYGKMYYSDNSGTLTNTAAYGRIKNFCQYKAHCVKVEKEDVIDVDHDKVSAFIDMSCNGKNVNSRNYFNVGFESSSTRQLSATVVECVYESLKNLVNGIAGYSSCKAGYTLNSDGYCGSDTKQTVEYKKSIGDNAFFDAKYYFVKGYELPVEINPFLKVQRNLKRIIIIVMTLSLILWGYKVVTMDYKKFRDYANRDFIKTIMPTVVKFVIVVWLALGSGWRDGLVDRLFGFVSSTYELSNRIFMNAITNKHNEILSKPVKLGIEKTINTLSGANINLIDFGYKYDVLGNLILSENVENSGKYTSILVSNNQEISELTYFISKLNKKYSANTYKLALIKDDNKTYSVSTEDIRTIWNNEYDGCYFDVSEYDKSKSYLAMFDAIDCRIVRYLGFAPGLNIANILLIPLFLTFFSTIGAFILSVVLTFMFTIFNLMVEVVFTFVISFFTLSLMIFLSPIILPMSLFKRTKSIFDKWLAKILSCIFQPVVLAVTVTVFINILDTIILKDMTFYNHNIEGRYPTIKCENTVGLFCIINKPSLAFVAAGDTITQGFNLIKSIIKGNFSLNDFPAITMLVDLLLIFMLFKLGNDLIAYAKTISEALFGKTSGLDGRSDMLKVFNTSKGSASSLSGQLTGYVSGNTKNIFGRPFAKIGYGLSKIGRKVEDMHTRRIDLLKENLLKTEDNNIKNEINKKIKKLEDKKDIYSKVPNLQKFIDDKILVEGDHVTKHSFKDFVKNDIYKDNIATLPKEISYSTKKLVKDTFGKKSDNFSFKNDSKFLEKYYQAAENAADNRLKDFKTKYSDKINEYIKDNEQQLKDKNDEFIIRSLINDYNENGKISEIDSKDAEIINDIDVLKANRLIDFENHKMKEEIDAIKNTKYNHKNIQKLWMIPVVNMLSAHYGLKDIEIQKQKINDTEKLHKENIEKELKNIFGDDYEEIIENKISDNEISESERKNFKNLKGKIERTLNKKFSIKNVGLKNSNVIDDNLENDEEVDESEDQEVSREVGYNKEIKESEDEKGSNEELSKELEEIDKERMEAEDEEETEEDEETKKSKPVKVETNEESGEDED